MTARSSARPGPARLRVADLARLATVGLRTRKLRAPDRDAQRGQGGAQFAGSKANGGQPGQVREPQPGRVWAGG